MKILIFYTDYYLNELEELSKAIKSIFKLKNKVSPVDFSFYDRHIYICDNQDLIQNILNSSVKIDNNVITKYKLIQILYLETDYLDCFDIVNKSKSYLIENFKNICYIPKNININEISFDIEFITLKLNLIKLYNKYSYDLNNLDNIITDYYILYNKDRLDYTEEFIDVICIWFYDTINMEQILKDLKKYFDPLNIKITEDNYTSTDDEQCFLLYDLNLKSEQYLLFSCKNLEDKVDDIRETFHLTMKRKCLDYINFKYGYIHNRSENGMSADYYQDKYILSDFDNEHCYTYGNEDIGDDIIMLSKKYKNDVKFFDIIH